MKKHKKITAIKADFIGNYLDRKMKNHNLPMSITYYNLLAKHEEAAEKAWKRKLKSINKSV